MAGAPILFQWSGDAMEPLRRFRERANEDFTVGEIYRMQVIEDRSAASHSHYFAALTEMWRSLPDNIADQFPTVDHLRKRALIMTGFHDERSIVAATKAEALRISSFIRPMDEYALVSVNECVVVVRTPKSQARKAMGKRVFQDSKDKTLDWVADLIGVKASDVTEAA